MRQGRQWDPLRRIPKAEVEGVVRVCVIVTGYAEQQNTDIDTDTGTDTTRATCRVRFTALVLLSC